MSRPTFLITGAQGQLGQSFSWLLQQQASPATDAILLGRAELDITDSESIAQALERHRPDVLINAAAYTAVDKAESEPGLARLVNGIAPGLLAQACASRGIGLLHVSTDYVFDGQAATPYAEDAPTGPVSAYGRSKLEGEQTVLSALPSAVVLRTSWVFSQFGNNFLKTMLRLGRERSELNIVADQLGGPSYAPHIAQVLLELAGRMAQDRKPRFQDAGQAGPSAGAEQEDPARPGACTPAGIYHYAGQPTVSWHDFAKDIFRQAVELGLLAKPPALTPIPASQYPTPARRPAQSALSQDRLDSLLGKDAIPRDWRAGVHLSLLALREVT